MARKLRIAWSVFFAVLTVALCVLWMRSYWICSTVQCSITADRGFFAVSLQGSLEIGVQVFQPTEPRSRYSWSVNNIPAKSYRAWLTDIEQIQRSEWADLAKANVPQAKFPEPRGAFGFLLKSSSVNVPYWFLVLLSGAIAALPWRVTHRFSLRTMLIATTLVAVVLGLAMWAAR